MNINSKKAENFLLAVGSVCISFCIGMTCGKMDTMIKLREKYSFQPKQTCFVMYTETCKNCNYDKVESSYSIISNKGETFCPNCHSCYEFLIDDKGEKIIKGGIR